MGLAVAIPAVLGYNALVRGNKGVLHKLNRFGHDLHALFVTGARVTQGVSLRAPPLQHHQPRPWWRCASPDMPNPLHRTHGTPRFF
jgi:biopolymer transport protein ExbB